MGSVDGVDARAFIAPTADVSETASIGPGAHVWHLAQVREHASVGARTTVGRGAYIGPGVQVGEDVKIQNSALVYEPATVEDGVFIGPAAVLTNDEHPRAVLPDGTLKTPSDWLPRGVLLRRGASIGARVVCIGPVEVGEWALVGAGAVVRRDVPAHALVRGVPARQAGWVGRAGFPLVDEGDQTWSCPATGEAYRLVAGTMRPA